MKAAALVLLAACSSAARPPRPPPDYCASLTAALHEADTYFDGVRGALRDELVEEEARIYETAFRLTGLYTCTVRQQQWDERFAVLRCWQPYQDQHAFYDLAERTQACLQAHEPGWVGEEDRDALRETFRRSAETAVDTSVTVHWMDDQTLHVFLVAKPRSTAVAENTNGLERLSPSRPRMHR